MAHNIMLSLAGYTWVEPKQTKLLDPPKNIRPELFAIAITETDMVPPAYADLPVPGALRQAFESDGMQAVITFSKGTSPNSGFRPKPCTAAVEVLVLPVSWEEVVAGVNSVLDHSRANNNVTRFGDVCIDFYGMEVRRSSGKQVILTAQEFKALKFFVSNPGRAISRNDLLNHAWGYDNYPCSRTVDNHVLKLRQKLEIDPSRPKHFLTVHGFGYKFLP